MDEKAAKGTDAEMVEKRILQIFLVLGFTGKNVKTMKNYLPESSNNAKKTNSLYIPEKSPGVDRSSTSRPFGALHRARRGNYRPRFQQL